MVKRRIKRDYTQEGEGFGTGGGGKREQRWWHAFLFRLCGVVGMVAAQNELKISF